MNLDPREYDLSELGLGEEPPHPSTAPDTPRPGGPGTRELFYLQQALGDEAAGKPYLETLPETVLAERLVFEWLETLVFTGGYQRTTAALQYYSAIGWLSEAVRHTLLDYLGGFPATVEHTATLTPEDHRTSLLFLARLAALR
jgi:archaellum component FlaD/FlaE